MDAVLLDGFIVAPLTSSLIRADSTETVVAGGPKVLVPRRAVDLQVKVRSTGKKQSV